MSDDLVKRLRYQAESDNNVGIAALLREAAERIEELENRADDLGWAATDAQDRRG